MDGRFCAPTSNKFLGIIDQQSAMDWRFPSIKGAILYSLEILARFRVQGFAHHSNWTGTDSTSMAHSAQLMQLLLFLTCHSNTCKVLWGCIMSCKLLIPLGSVSLWIIQAPESAWASNSLVRAWLLIVDFITNKYIQVLELTQFYQYLLQIKMLLLCVKHYF